jgi:hypothetical protein
LKQQIGGMRPILPILLSGILDDNTLKKLNHASYR